MDRQEAIYLQQPKAKDAPNGEDRGAATNDWCNRMSICNRWALQPMTVAAAFAPAVLSSGLCHAYAVGRMLLIFTFAALQFVCVRISQRGYVQV